MKKFKFDNLLSCEDGFVSNGIIEFDEVSELNEDELMSVYYMLDGNSGDSLKIENMFENVNDIVSRMEEDGCFKCDENGEKLRDDFLFKYGSMKGINWSVEYDSNCVVVLRGCRSLNKLRKDVIEKYLFEL